MFTFLFTLTALAASIAAQITVITPDSPNSPSAIQCEVYEITWTSGTGLFDVRVLDSAHNLLEDVTGIAPTSPQQWTVNQTAGTVCMFRIQDATGVSATSGLFTVQSGSPPNTACLSTSTSGASSAIGSSVASSAPSVTTSITGASSTSPIPSFSTASSAASGVTDTVISSSATSAAASQTQSSAASSAGSRADLLGAVVAGLLALAA